jgi:hypothetical protein
MRSPDRQRPSPTRNPSPPAHPSSFDHRHGLAHEFHAVISAGGELIRSIADVVGSHAATITVEPSPGGTASAGVPDDQWHRHVVVLIYELLDAHDDTAQIAAEFTEDPVWQAHLEYLRGLQRTGREVLARITLEDERTRLGAADIRSDDGAHRVIG